MPDPNQKIVNSLARRRKSVYGAIRAMESASIRMIAQHMEVDRCQVTARLDELRDMGIIQFSHKALDPVTGITVSYWKTRQLESQPEEEEYQYTIDGVPYTWIDFIKKAEEWGFDGGVIQTTSMAAAYLRKIGHTVGEYRHE